MMDPAVEALVERIMLLPGTGRLTRDDVHDILDCLKEDNAVDLLGVLVEDYTEAGKMPPASWWRGVIDILTPISAVASLVIPIVSLALML